MEKENKNNQEIIPGVSIADHYEPLWYVIDDVDFVDEFSSTRQKNAQQTVAQRKRK